MKTFLCVSGLIVSASFIVHAQPPLKPLDDRPVSTQETGELESVFAAAKAAHASIRRGTNALAQHAAIDRELHTELETFLTNHIASAWSPSVRIYLGESYRARGQTTRVLEHWRTAWELTKDYQAGNGKQIGDEALVHWTRLLVLMGRTDQLNAIYQAHGNRTFDHGALSQMWRRTYEKHVRMQKYPAQAWKCGIYAVAQVAQTLDVKYKKGEFLRTPSKAAGFTLQELQDLSDKYGLGLVAVRRLENSGQLIVPSVVHLQQEHYTAIIERRGEIYKVVDPSGLGVLWLTEAEINAEASGHFLIPQKSMNGSLVRVGAAEAGLVFGRDGPCPPEDWEDTPCEPPENSATQLAAGSEQTGETCDECPPGSGGGPDGPGRGNGCGTGRRCATTSAIPAMDNTGLTGGPLPHIGGAPSWRVSEPYLNVWMDDVPVRYMPAKGPTVVLEMRYKQRNEDVWYSWAYPRVAVNWNCNWFSFAYDLADGAKVVLPGGGELTFEFPQNSNLSYREYRNNSQLEALIESDVLVGYILHYPDGRKLKYTRVYSVGSVFQLSEQIDPRGNKLTLNYNNTLVSSITDADGNDTQLYYTNQVYLARVVTPDGREVQLTQDQYGQLTNIVDAAGISSSLTYNSWADGPASLTTPYGTTYFDITGSYFAVDRSVIITQPDGGRQAYALWHENTNVLTGFASSQMPTNTPFATNGYPYGTLDVTNRHERNTFYWNAQQFAALGTTNFADFTWAELKRARIRHWLGKFSPDSDNHVDTLAHEQAPSQDGTTEGQITWYDYNGKDYTATDLRGTQIMPAVIARVMPDGTTWYQYFERNTNSHPTKDVESWVDSGSTLYRTNIYVYAANGIDRLAHTNVMGILASSNVFNAYHQVTTNCDALGQPTVYTYNASRQVTSVSRPSGLITTNIYDGNGRLQEVSDLPINATRAYTWYTDGNLKTVTDERGAITTNFWDGLGRLAGTADSRGATSNLYVRGGTKLLDLTGTKDCTGFWTYYDYDSLRRRIAVTNANGIVTRYGYCDCGSVGSVTNAWNTSVEQVTTFDYDYQGNLLRTTYADGYAVTNWYNALAQQTVTGDGWGYNWFGYSYNNLGQLTRVTNGLGQVERSIVYDIEDQAIYVIDANGVTITNTYDALGRLRTRGYPDGGVEKFGYSARGLIAYTNQLGLTNFYVYDEAGRKIFETNANAEVIRYTNSAAGDLLSLTDGKNQTTRWNYDEFGHVTNKLDQAGTEILRYTYDADGRLASRWSAAKGTTYYTNDAVGNLTKINYPASTDVTLQYDPLNRVTNMVDAVGTTKYAYTAGGQLWTEDGPFSSDTVTNTYWNRMRTNLSLQQPTGVWTNAFAYDAAKRLTNVTSPAGSFTYTLGGASSTSPLIKTLLLPNTSYITNTYDNVARLLSTKLNNSSHTTLDSYAYVYNPANQRTNLTRTDSSTYDFTYDPIGQLKVANSSVNTEDRGYAYDSAWNLNYRTNNGVLGTFTVDSRNQLTQDPAQLDSYDGNGNLVSRTGSYTYTYDDENRLTSWVVGTTYNTGFVYDGLGRLRKRIEYTWNGISWNASTITTYIYDGMRVIQERESSPTVSYTRGTDLSGSLEGAGGIGGLLARSHGYSSGNWSTHNSYHADGDGDITYLVNSSQTLAASYRYDPFGNTISSSGSLASANVYRFSSKEIHVNSGMYYYGYRFYDPSLQRWINRDPIEEEGGKNLYAFLENNPINRIDPYGRRSFILPTGDLLEASSGICCNFFSGSRTRTKAIERGVNIGDTKFGGNAYLHCVATCRASRSCGRGPAKWFWDGREKRGTPDDDMDLANNGVGYGIKGDCWKGCGDAWKNGTLTCLDKNDQQVPCEPPPVRIKF